MRTRALLLCALALVWVSPLRAADLPVKAIPVVPSWTGFYAGLGAGLQSTLFTARDISATENNVPDVCANGGQCFFSQSLNNTQVRFSFYGGFNWQLGSDALIGFEVDSGWANAVTSLVGTAFPGGPYLASGFATDSFSINSIWDGSARLRAGYIVTPTFMIYATGGAAVLHFSSTVNCGPDPVGTCAFPVPAFTRTTETTQLGWTAGGGIETRVYSNLLIRGEYRFSDYGTVHITENLTANGVANVYAYDIQPRTHTALIGFAYLFGH